MSADPIRRMLDTARSATRKLDSLLADAPPERALDVYAGLAHAVLAKHDAGPLASMETLSWLCGPHDATLDRLMTIVHGFIVIDFAARAWKVACADITNRLNPRELAAIGDADAALKRLVAKSADDPDLVPHCRLTARALELMRGPYVIADTDVAFDGYECGLILGMSPLLGRFRRTPISVPSSWPLVAVTEDLLARRIADLPERVPLCDLYAMVLQCYTAIVKNAEAMHGHAFALNAAQ